MTRKFLHLATVAGVAVLLASVSACGDDSTATAPITGNPVTTTSMYTTDSASPAAPSESASDESGETSEGSDPAEETSKARAAGSQLPATAPESTAPVTGPDGQALSAKAKKYLASLKKQNVSFMGDSDGSVALTMAEYICAERTKGTDPVTVKAYVTASVGPGTTSIAEANTKADKVIKTAHSEYC